MKPALTKPVLSRPIDFEYEIVEDTFNVLVIRDTGHLTGRTLTNAAADVVLILASHLRARTLLYYDSDGILSQMLVNNGRFAGFAPVPP